MFFFALVLVLISISYLVYYKFNSSNSISSQAIDKGKLTKPSVKDSIKIISPRKIIIKSKNLLALKYDVRLKSEQEFKNYTLIFESVKLDINNSTLSFDVKVGKSKYLALTVLWGPLSTGGCVSCKNALFKNPGSKSILGLNDSMYEYQVIALATH